MNLTRRTFLGMTGGASLAVLTGCGAVSKEQVARLFPELQALRMGPIDPPERGVPESPGKDEISHVLARLSYGPRPADYARVRAMGIDAYIEEQLAPDHIDDLRCDLMVRRLETLDDPAGMLFEYRDDLLYRELAKGTLLRAVYSRRQLREIMVEFWTNHFNIDSSKGDCRWLKTADDREIIRALALGSFPQLLRATALSPAMLWYLDGRVNSRRNPADMPNENYARELLELHSLGVHGGYTQQDVMEVARCLTGWTVRSEQAFYKGRVEFHPDAHDDGVKVVLGHTIPAGLGEEDVDRIIEIVCNHPSTATHIAAKLCRRFISDSPPDTAVATVAQAFRASGGDIRGTLRALFHTPEFRTARDTKLKRPYHFLVSALRATGAKTDGGPAVQDYLVRMGHAPFQYPTPDGYPDETEPWLGTMLWRWHFSIALAENRLDATRVDWDGLNREFGGNEGVVAHLAQRQATPLELAAYRAGGPGVILSSPGFQRY